jgi:hypothetical protein
LGRFRRRHAERHCHERGVQRRGVSFS